MPRRLTLRAAEKIARAHDPKAWDAMTPAERRELVKEVNAHHERRAADQAAIDAYLSNPGMKPRAKRKR